MRDEQKVKAAARRMENQKRQSQKRESWVRRAWRAICRFFRRIWNWICSIDLIGLLNLALLIVIIVLFIHLILDLVRFRCARPVIVASDAPVVATIPTNTESVRNANTNDTVIENVVITDDSLNEKHTVSTNKNTTSKQCEKCSVSDAQIAATHGQKMYGDIIVDNTCTGNMIQRGATIRGNLYLQDMRKYTLPCDVHIDGNLFIRDVYRLRFCGKFTVTGNIYVTPQSTFGPIPQTAIINGQIIL